MNSKLDLTHVSQVVEVCLLTATKPLSLNQLAKVFAEPIAQNLLAKIIHEIGQKYLKSGIELIQVATGYRFRSRLEFQPYLNKLYQIKPPKYSRAIMETLAIITYRQPITRGEIEEIRGISLNSGVIQTLMERNWIEVIGYKPVPGKPEILATTNKFLEDLGITSLEQLPVLPTININNLNLHQDLIEEYQQKESNE